MRFSKKLLAFSLLIWCLLGCLNRTSVDSQAVNSIYTAPDEATKSSPAKIGHQCLSNFENVIFRDVAFSPKLLSITFEDYVVFSPIVEAERKSAPDKALEVSEYKAYFFPAEKGQTIHLKFLPPNNDITGKCKEDLTCFSALYIEIYDPKCKLAETVFLNEMPESVLKNGIIYQAKESGNYTVNISTKDDETAYKVILSINN